MCVTQLASERRLISLVSSRLELLGSKKNFLAHAANAQKLVCFTPSTLFGLPYANFELILRYDFSIFVF